MLAWENLKLRTLEKRLQGDDVELEIFTKIDGGNVFNKQFC